MPRGQKVSPHHRGRRKTHFLVRTSTIFGADVHDPKGCWKTLYKKSLRWFFGPYLNVPSSSAALKTCALSGPVLADTARLSRRHLPFARYGVFGVSTWPIGCDTPSPFLSVSPLESMRSGGAIEKGYLSSTCAIPQENKANRVLYPPLRYYLENVLRDMGRYPALGP